MIELLRVKTKGKIVNSPHFWVIVIITFVLMFFYLGWPWRSWKLNYGIWHWLPFLSSLYKLALWEYANHVVGILFFIPIIYSAIVFSWRGAMATSFLALGMVLAITAGMWSTNSAITNAILLLLPFLVVSIVSFELQSRRKEKMIFAEREAERQLYISKVLDSQETERQRIAQELHDDTIQTLLTIANRAQTFVTSDEDAMKEEKEESAEWIRDTSLEAVESLRRTILDLRPSVLDDLGMVPALRWLVDRMNKESNIRTRLFLEGEERKLFREAEATIFRVVQEALTNIKRHSKATEASVTLQFDAECLKITIEDNGQGFSPPKPLHKLVTTNKLGLTGIQQRIKLLNGTLRIRSNSGKGTKLFIELKGY